MASWAEIERDAPDLARDARNLLAAHVHKTIATLRADGSPRISGIEAKDELAIAWWTETGGARRVTRR